MMEVLELVTPPPVQMSSSPASFMRSSYSPSGNGRTRSNFCRSTHRCSSPGLSSVSLPIWYIDTTTTLIGIGADDTAGARTGAGCMAAARSRAACDDPGASTPIVQSARFKAATHLHSAPVVVFNGIPFATVLNSAQAYPLEGNES